ncbi:acid protease [Pseudovirgaria hyperparasitica]|uniref:Acid protease n=1 Tax=Pseudovirgaria hyperparasitica TaxID=470096 RepID=A0A6A6W103_9PEZI|nr:acid protease [Pseudovirgaria hyperparasitica]KAF2755257.1 acid protease [Pseudovirgaria hyperparasitica]
MSQTGSLALMENALSRNAMVALVAFVLFSARSVIAAGSPINLPPSQWWDGNDGPWSTFSILVGTPAQNVRVIPGTGQSSTSVVDSAYCYNSDGSVKYTDCLKDRGLMYTAGDSSTYESKGMFDVSLYWENNLGIAANATYGYDTITLGIQGSGLPSLTHQLISAVQVRQYWLGTLALNPRPLNFTDLNNPQESLLQALRKLDDPIPSTSWSYTAGSYNHEPKAFGSLVLGGYDTTYFTPNDVTFDFYQDISTDTMVAVQSIGSNITDQSLLSSGIFAYVDTLVPEIWLPTAACQAFEDTFGIEWDETASLYKINDTIHDDLLQKNPVVTFKIGPGLTGDAVNIEMPYTNLYLTASSPKVQNSTRYFPLRRAESDNQYTLGRAFLQSAHLSVDYERQIFNISQALYPSSNTPQNLVAILEPTVLTANSTDVTQSGHDRLATGAIAGIAIGAIAVITVVVIIFFFVYRRHRRAKNTPFDPRYDKAELDAIEQNITIGPNKQELDASSDTPHEVLGGTDSQAELDADERSKRQEVDGDVPRPVFEMAAEPVSLPELDTPDAKDPDAISRMRHEMPTSSNDPHASEKSALEAHQPAEPVQRPSPRYEEVLLPPSVGSRTISPQAVAEHINRRLSPDKRGRNP